MAETKTNEVTSRCTRSLRYYWKTVSVTHQIAMFTAFYLHVHIQSNTDGNDLLITHASQDFILGKFDDQVRESL